MEVILDLLRMRAFSEMFNRRKPHGNAALPRQVGARCRSSGEGAISIEGQYNRIAARFPLPSEGRVRVRGVFASLPHVLNRTRTKPLSVLFLRASGLMKCNHVQ